MGNLLGFSINKILLAIIGALLVLLTGYYGYNKYLGYKLDVSRNENKKLETKAVAVKQEHKIIVFETNESMSIKKDKEVKDEEIPSDIGFHTIIFDDD